MGFAKGQRAQFTTRSGVHHGHVKSVGAAGVTLVLDDWRVTKALPATAVKPSTEPVKEGGPGHRVFGKGDRVEFKDENGRLVHGTVESGDMFGGRVVLDGGGQEYRVGMGAVAPSSKVLPVPAPSVMDDWGVRSYKPVPGMSEETTAFTALITYKGKPALKAMNGGQGTPNEYRGEPDMVARFHADAKAWLDEAGVEHIVDGPADFVHWHAKLRPYAVDAKDYLRETDERIGQYIHMPRNP